MRAGLVLIALLGCGGSQKPPPPPPPPPPANPTPPADPTPPVASEPSSQQICHRLVELKTQKCAMFAGADIDEAGCIKELEASANEPMVKVITGCVMQTSCEEVQNCVTATAQKLQEEQQKRAAQGNFPTDVRACGDHSNVIRPAGFPKAEWEKRNGANATKYSQVVATRDKPVESCGVQAENEWLVAMSCNDGSHPIQSGNDAENARNGSVGAGGRCGSVIDHYVVKCPEKTYDIFMDAYVCPNP